FNHPARDFAKTDEALRIRQNGGTNRVTYKGPKVDLQTKTRREIEIAFGESPGDGERFAEMLRLLGFREVRAVRKRRTPCDLTWDGRSVEVSLDEVDGLGTFVEIETEADEESRGAARDAILRLAERLNLANSERRSYLCLLLERDQMTNDEARMTKE
ncbi:MAG TPA: class IV adenylate cyclase, partial [Planctomycetaceae bacterium]|nr:class IV adenylate cyclase [Planctomycetaceae bacterium]